MDGQSNGQQGMAAQVPNASVTNQNTEVPSRPFFKSKLGIGILSCVVLLIITAGVLLFLFRGSSGDRALARVFNQTIYESDIVSEYRLGYPGSEISGYSDIDPEIADSLLEIMVNEALMERYALYHSITIIEGEIDERIQSMRASGVSEDVLRDPGVRADVRRAILQEKVSAATTEWREFEIARIFVSPAINFEENFAIARVMMDEFRANVVGGMSFSEGYQVALATPNAPPGLFIFTERMEGSDDSSDPQLFEAVFALDVGGVTPVIDSLGGTLEFAKIIGASAGTFETLDAWIADQQGNVEYYNS